MLAHGLLWSGLSFLFSKLPARDSLVVLNYHRIGNIDDDHFASGVLSATAEQFNDQISHLKQRVSLVTLEEALAFVNGTLNDKARTCRVLITLDDGYLDNYEVAYPILRSHGVQGVFFLATSLVGSSEIPWWDHVAYLVRTAQRRRFSLHYPVDLAVDIDRNGIASSLRAISRLYRSQENTDAVRFIGELAVEAKGRDLPSGARRFLNWDEAGEMAKGGMAFGSHTHSHLALSQMKPEELGEELSVSRAILKEKLALDIDALAYPFGNKKSFTGKTQQAARVAGYRAAFSFYGGTNLPGKTSPLDIRRISIEDKSRSRFRVQTSICRSTGIFWP